MKRRIVEFLRRYATDQPDDHAIDLIQHIAEAVDRMEEPVAKKVKEDVPFVPHGTVTHKIWKCDHCKSRVAGSDKYCHECGWILRTEPERVERTEKKRTGLQRVNRDTSTENRGIGTSTEIRGIDSSDAQYFRRWP